MAENHTSVEADEQIELDGDNDIEDMMDDEGAGEDKKENKGFSFRIFTAKDAALDELMAVPPHGSKVFICAIPRDATNEELRAYCESFGEICQALLEKDKDKKEDEEGAGEDKKKTEIFSFIELTKKDAAHDEVLAFSSLGSEVFIRGIPRDTTDEELRDHCESFVEICKARLEKYKDKKEDATSPLKDEDTTGVGIDEEERKKHTELLALPPHGSEVFICGLPRDATDEELRDHCESFGEIYEVQLQKDKDKKENKGSALIVFTTKDAAQMAIEEIQDKEFKGKTLRCSLWQVKHRLLIGNVPKSLAEEELRRILEESGPGVENIEFFKDPQNPSSNHGFVFVEYYNNACADYARQKMSRPNFKIDGSSPTVSWADPKNSADASTADQMTVMLKVLQQKYARVKHEMVRWDELQSQLLSQFGDASSIITRLPVLKEDKNYGPLIVLPGIKEALLGKQTEALEMIYTSMTDTIKEFHRIVLSFEEIARDADQLLKGSTPYQMQLRVGMHPTLQQCLEGLNTLHKMHKSEYLLKSSILSSLISDYSKCSVDDIAAFRQLLVDQPNISKDEVQTIFELMMVS